MKIAICDNNSKDLALLTTLLNEYYAEHPFIFFDTYTNPFELLSNIKERSYQILLLDAIMPGINGIELAREIRQYDEKIKIIFLSTSAEYAVESYTVNAFYYMLKPITAELLYPVLDKLMGNFVKKDELLYIKTHKQILSIQFFQIVYVEITRKILHFYLIDGTQYDVTAPLSEYEPLLLNQEEFIKVHRSYIVNMRYIRAMKTNEFTTSTGKTVPISKRLYPNVRDQYMKYSFGSQN